MASQHKAIRDLIRDTVLSLADNLTFSYASSDYANSQKKKYPFVRLDPLRQVVNFSDDSIGMTKRYRVALAFYEADRPSGAESITNDILDEMDELSDKFLAKMNDTLTDDGSEDISTSMTQMGTIQKTPFIKLFADQLSGYLIEFELTVPDTFDYCSV